MHRNKYAEKIEEFGRARDTFYNYVTFKAASEAATEVEKGHKDSRYFLYRPRDYEFDYVDTEDRCQILADLFELILPDDVGIGYLHNSTDNPSCTVTILKKTDRSVDYRIRKLRPGYRPHVHRYYCKNGDNCNDIITAIAKTTSKEDDTCIKTTYHHKNNILYATSTAKRCYEWTWFKSFF